MSVDSAKDSNAPGFVVKFKADDCTDRSDKLVDQAKNYMEKLRGGSPSSV